MLELEVILDFSCCFCRQPMGVTLRCAGKGLALGRKARASAKVPCPTCGSLNKVVFAPDGTVHHLIPCELPNVPEPSIN